MAITEQERRRRVAAERARQERLRLEEKRRADELEGQRLGIARQEQEQRGRQQQSQDLDAARRREREDFDNSVAGQSYQIAKTVVPPAVGLYVGHRQASGIEARQARMAPEARAAMGTGRRFVPYAARSAMFLPEGYYLREHVAPGIESETGRDLVRGAGTGMMLAGAGLIGEGAVKSLTPAEGMGPRGPAPPASPPAPPSAQPAPPAPRPHSERLINAARAAGATGPLNKTSAAAYLETNLNAENRAAVARELGVNSGRNFASRISQSVRDMASTRGASSLLLPFAAGGIAYDAASSEAKAAGASPTEATGRGALAGGAAAGTTYGLSKLAPYAANLAGKSMLGRVAMRAIPPAAGALAAYDIGGSVLGGLAQGEDVAGADAALRQGNPGFHAGQEALRSQAYGEQPADLARARQGMRSEQQADRFDADLQAFLDAVDEHNAGVGGGEAYGP